MKTPVLAVFGNTLWFTGDAASRSRQLPDGANLTAAMLQLLAEAGGQPGQVNLLYHPVDLQVVAAECANVSRSKLKAYFSGEYREIANPAIFWAATRPAPHLDGKYTTLLHHEQRPRLEHLMQTLEERGIRVRVALPPAAALAARSRAERLELAFLVAEDCTFFYHVNELGIPTARFGRSFETLSEHLAVALASRKHPPANILVVADTPPQPILDLLETHALRGSAKSESWQEFVRTITFAPSDVANMATRPFRWKQDHTKFAVAALFAIAGICLTADYTVSLLQVQRQALQRDQRRTELERAIATLEKTEERYRRAEALVAAVAIANPRPSALLDAVTQSIPTDLQLNGYRYQAGQFTLEGVAYEGVGQEKGPASAFLSSLSSGGQPWVFNTPRTTLSGSTWTLSGTINPKSDP